MENTFTPLILACNPLDSTCTSLVPPGFLELMPLDACKAMIDQVLPSMETSQPLFQFFSQCVNWLGM